MTEPALPSMNESPREWLRRELAERDITGRTTPEVARELTARMPYEHIPHWSVTGLDKGIRAILGPTKTLVPAKGAGSEAGPLVVMEQMPFPEFKEWGRRKAAFGRGVFDSLRDDAKLWHSANPDCGMTVDEILTELGAA